jgi:hypothetical protein
MPSQRLDRLVQERAPDLRNAGNLARMGYQNLRIGHCHDDMRTLTHVERETTQCMS